jgi:hypothetical protein
MHALHHSDILFEGHESSKFFFHGFPTNYGGDAGGSTACNSQRDGIIYDAQKGKVELTRVGAAVLGHVFPVDASELR